MTIIKTGEDRWVLTSQRSVLMLSMQTSMEGANILNTAVAIARGRTMIATSRALMVTPVTELTTESKSFTIQINTKPNFVRRILSPIRTQNVITKNFVPLHTILMSYL